MSATTSITKSLYSLGVQCPKMLWLKVHKPELFDESTMNDSIREKGTEVGQLARGLFGPYTVIERESQMVSETERLIASGEKIIAEASFSADGLFCSVDILKNLGDKKVELYEVKSSSGASDIYYHDIAFQLYVLEKSGYTVQKANLVYINNKYVRKGDLELDKLFAIEDLTETVRQMQTDVHERIQLFKDYIAQKEEPVFALGTHCFKPYSCGFWKHCSTSLPKHNVFGVVGMGKKEMGEHYNRGIISFEELLSKADLKPKFKMQVQFEVEDLSDHIETDKINEFLDSLSYPLYFLDFESFQAAVPLYDDSWPYEQIPFQYSLHFIEEKGGPVQHKEYLAYAGKDPRRELAERLCEDIPLNVCTLAYHMSFEKERISELAKLFPDLSEQLLNIRENIVDLEDPFKHKYYYTKAMKGKSSIKFVLPALFPNDPDLDYSNLEEIHKGDEASAAFIAMEKKTPEEVAVTRDNLLKYCELDTYAMVKVLEKLQEVAEQKY